jgi:hypothetical protein
MPKGAYYGELVFGPQIAEVFSEARNVKHAGLTATTLNKISQPRLRGYMSRTSRASANDAAPHTKERLVCGSAAQPSNGRFGRKADVAAARTLVPLGVDGENQKSFAGLRCSAGR